MNARAPFQFAPITLPLALGGHHHGASHDHSRIIRHSYHTEHYVHLTHLAYDAWREAEAESAYRDLDATSANGIQYVRDNLCFPIAAGSFEDGMGA